MLQNATVTFSRTIKPADYESKKCEVTLVGIVNSDVDLDRLAHIAHEQLVKMLGMPDKHTEPAKPVVAIPRAERPETIPPTSAKTNGAADPLGGVEASRPVVPSAPAAPVQAHDDFMSPAAAEITNEKIKDTCLAKSQELQAAGKPVVAIRNVIASFVEPPKTAYDIPQEQRGAFLAKIAEL